METGFEARKDIGLLATDDGEAARLVEIGGDLGEELVVGEADGNGDADFVLDALCEAAHADGGACVMQPLGAGEIEKGLVDGDGFDKRRQVAHQRADIARDACIFCHVGFHDDGFRAGGERLEHGHGGAHAADARDVAAGGDDAARAAADDEGLVAKLRIVALLDGGIEGVAIHVGDGKRVKLGMEEKARPAAGRATLRALRHGREAVAAEALRGGHGEFSGTHGIIDKYGEIAIFWQPWGKKTSSRLHGSGRATGISGRSRKRCRMEWGMRCFVRNRARNMRAPSR